MSYSDVVQAAVNNAHDTAIANKIIDMMRNLKLKMMIKLLVAGFGS